MKAPCQLSTVNTSLVSLSVIKPVLYQRILFQRAWCLFSVKLSDFSYQCVLFSMGQLGVRLYLFAFVSTTAVHLLYTVACIYVCLEPLWVNITACANFITGCWSHFELYIKYFVRYSYS